MKFYITYFYNVRFFKPNMVPVSTAIWDPKWFHDFKNQDIVFKDKNGVLNGIRYPLLSPIQLESHLCPCEDKNPSCCTFILNYKKYLYTINFKELIKDLSFIGTKAKEILGFNEEPEICLLVHEKTDNPCSERGPLIQYFHENGIELVEWSKSITKNNE